MRLSGLLALAFVALFSFGGTADAGWLFGSRSSRSGCAGAQAAAGCSGTFSVTASACSGRSVAASCAGRSVRTSRAACVGTTVNVQGVRAAGCAGTFSVQPSQAPKTTAAPAARPKAAAPVAEQSTSVSALGVREVRRPGLVARLFGRRTEVIDTVFVASP